MPEPVMPIDEAIDFAKQWSDGRLYEPGAMGWRVVSKVLADEVERLRSLASGAINADLERVAAIDALAVVTREREALAAALRDAAASLETLANHSGKDKHLEDIQSIRGYAANRSAAARQAVKASFRDKATDAVVSDAQE